MENYKIAVALAMTGNHAAFLSGLSSKLLHVHAQVKDLEGGLGRLNRIKLAVGGGLAIAGGAAGLAMVGKMVDRGNELVKIQQNMAAAGVKATEVQEAYAKAWTLTGKYQNVGAAEALKVISEARMTFGSQHEATHHAEDFVKMVSFLKAFQGGKHGEGAANFEAEAIAAMKSGEIAGKVSPAEMAEHVKQLTAMRVAYGDQLKIGQYLTAQRAAGVALRNSSDAFRYGMFPALVQENGQGAGTMLMTAFNKIVAGTGNRTRSLEHMADIGLLKRDQLLYDKNGRIKGLKDPDAIKNNNAAAYNFGDWVMSTLKPRLDAQLDKEGVTGRERAVREAKLISAMFPDRNAAKAITEVLQQFSKLTKDAALMAEARKSLDESAYLDKSWEGQKQALETQWHNLLEGLGSPMVAHATSMLRDFNQSMSGVAQWAGLKENAEAVSNIFKGIAVGAAALTGAGAVALLAAIGPAGWVAAGIIALGGAFMAFKPQMETWIRDVTGLGKELDGADRAFHQAALGFGNWVKNLPFDQIVQAHIDYGMRLNKWLQSWFPNIGLNFFGGGDGKDKEKNGDLQTKVATFFSALTTNIDQQWEFAGNAIKSSWEVFKQAWLTGIEQIKTWPTLLTNEISGWPSRLSEAIAGMGSGIIAKMKEALNPLNWGGKGGSPDGSKPAVPLNPEDELPGVQKQSFNGAGFRDLIQSAAFGSSGGSLADAVYSGVMRAFSELMGKGGGSGGGLGGMIQNASLGGSGAANDNGGGGVGRALRSGGSGAITGPLAGAPTAGLQGEVRNYLRSAALAQGIDPNVAERVMRQESGFNPYRNNLTSRERSYGVFQLNTMGGLGNVAERQGINPRDPSQWRKHIDFSLGIVKKDGWRQWYGARDVGISRWQGVGTVKPVPMQPPAPPPPTVGPPPRQRDTKPVMVDLHMDGRKMGRAMAMHIADDHRFPKKAGGMDTHGSMRSPGTPVSDAA